MKLNYLVRYTLILRQGSILREERNSLGKSSIKLSVNHATNLFVVFETPLSKKSGPPIQRSPPPTPRNLRSPSGEARTNSPITNHCKKNALHHLDEARIDGVVKEPITRRLGALENRHSRRKDIYIRTIRSV